MEEALDDSAGDRTGRIGHHHDDRHRIAFCSLIGPSHVAQGGACEDAAGYAIFDSWLVAVVSDGAGSARRGGQTARKLATELPDRLARSLAQADRDAALDKVLEAAIDTLRAEIAAEAEADGDTIDDCHATIVGAACADGIAALFHIGDGAIGCFCTGESDADWMETRFSAPENGDFANETVFFSMPGWRRYLRITTVERWDSMLLMSDGVTPFALDTGQQGCDMAFVSPLLRFLEDHDPATGARSIRNLLARPDVRAISDDDKTLMWVHRPALPATLPPLPVSDEQPSNDMIAPPADAVEEMPPPQAQVYDPADKSGTLIERAMRWFKRDKE